MSNDMDMVDERIEDELGEYFFVYPAGQRPARFLDERDPVPLHVVVGSGGDPTDGYVSKINFEERWFEVTKPGASAPHAEVHVTGTPEMGVGCRVIRDDAGRLCVGRAKAMPPRRPRRSK